MLANFSKEYEEYIRTIEDPELGYPFKMVPDIMVMEEYGPFNIMDAEDMKELARHVVAYYCEIQRTT